MIYATEGRDSGTGGRFVEDLKAHQGDPEQVGSVTGDMSQALLSGVNQHLPQAAITYDRYHVVAKLNEAVDQVRREEAWRRPELAGSRYPWLKNEANLTEPQLRQKIWLSRPSAQLATARAWLWKDHFNGFYEQPVRQAEALPRALVRRGQALPPGAAQDLRPDDRGPLGVASSAGTRPEPPPAS